MAMRALVSKLRIPVAASSRRSFRSSSTASQGQPNHVPRSIVEDPSYIAMRDAIIENQRCSKIRYDIFAGKVFGTKQELRQSLSYQIIVNLLL
uniref:Uncharacterized protein n=1 Tax=Oryza brachyantha TaxID=4533 RepID=J3MIJ7_ORYBR